MGIKVPGRRWQFRRTAAFRVLFVLLQNVRPVEGQGFAGNGGVKENER